MRIHFAFADSHMEYNTSLFRCLIPAEELRRRGHEVTAAHYSTLCEYDHLDACIIERNLFDPELVEQFYRLKDAGTRVIVTFDDAYHLMPFLPDDYPSKGTWTPNALSLFRRTLRCADAVIVPSRKLAECYHADYVPNFYDAELYENVAHTPDPVRIRILWGGNDSHYNGLVGSHVIEALERICKRHPEVVVRVVGTSKTLSVFLKHLPRRQLEVFTWQPLQQWIDVVADSDIGIAPLEGEYDQYRSWVKAVDYGVLGIPFVATQNEVYLETGAMLVPNDDWYNALTTLIVNPQARRLAGDLLHCWMEDQSIQKNGHVYEHLCAGGIG